MTVQPIKYAEALAWTAKQRRHLLLGNGFSIAARRQFNYNNLMAVAAERAADDVFQELGTKNFELAMRTLTAARDQASLEGEDARRDRLGERIDALRNYLCMAVALVHPGTSFDMRQDEFLACRDFLRPYIGRNVVPHGVVFTTNYDLLLYWAVVRNLARHSRGTLDFHDGFEDENWNSQWMINEDLSVVYVHGSLHIFEEEDHVQRVRYRHGVEPQNLMTQIRSRMDQGDMPLFVSEGSGQEKSIRMKQSLYLKAALEKFKRVCRYPAESLFTVGHSLSEPDAHLTDLIGNGKIGRVFIGAYNGLDSNDGRRAVELSEQWRQMRLSAKVFHPLGVFVFDSAECEMWAKQ